jgi:branched-chain amino acid aminotransferase
MTQPALPTPRFDIFYKYDELTRLLFAYAEAYPTLVAVRSIGKSHEGRDIMLEDGHISEGSAANVFMLRNGVWATPQITDNILEGITRRSIIHFMREDLKWDVVERSIDRTEVYLADEMFFAGTGVQIAAITKVDHRDVGTGKMGPRTAEVKKLFMEVVHGRNPKYRDWCYPIYEKATGPSAKRQDHVSVK